MKFSKKINIFLFIITFALCVYTGCAVIERNENNNDELNNEDPIIIEIWTYYKARQQEMLNVFIKEFNETKGIELGIIVKQSSFGEIDALTDALLSANKSDGGSAKMPDMFITFKGVASQLKNVEFINFKNYLSDVEIESYVDAFVHTGATVKSNGDLHMFSIGKASEVLLINKTEFDRLAELGVLDYDDLKDYEALAEMAERYYEYTDGLTEEPGDGKALFGIDSLVNVVLKSAAELGQDIVTMENGVEKINLDRREIFEKIYRYIYVPYAKKHYATNSRYVTEDIRSRLLIVGQCATSGIPFFPKDVVNSEGDLIPIEGKVANTPSFRGAENYFLIQGGGVFGVKHSEKASLAMVEFLKWLTNEENAIKFSMSISYLPPRKSSFSREVVEKALNDETIDKLLADTYLLMFEKMSSSKPYEPLATQNYELVRKTIDDYFISSIAHGRALYSSGEDIDSEKYFEEWYSGLREAVEDALSKVMTAPEYIQE